MRLVLGILHRWIGLAIAAFIVFSGLTGAVISWDHELDELINPHLLKSETAGERIPPLEIVKRAQEAEPKAYVSYVNLNPELGHNYEVMFRPRVDPATGKLYSLGFNRVYYDPVTGVEVGRRDWGAPWPITRETIVSFLYRFHYTLHMPSMWGIDRWGHWLFGIVAAVWTIDCFIGFYLTLPIRKARKAIRAVSVERELSKGFWPRWKPAWKIKTSGSAYRINFDIHRAFGLWCWTLLLIVAFTGFSLNLFREAFYPMMSLISKVTPTIFVTRAPAPLNSPIDPKLTFPEVFTLAEAQGRELKLSAPLGALWYVPRWGVYGASYFQQGDDHGAAGVGPARVVFDGQDGRFLDKALPWQGTIADIFVQAQFPLHSGRILGLPGRILISVIGLVSAALAITGVVIWYRKRRARVRVQVSNIASMHSPQPAE